MTFGLNVNHISQGLLSGAYPGLIIDLKKPAIPIVYNVIDNVTLVNLLNVMLLPKPKVFVGSMKFEIFGIGDGAAFSLIDPANNNSFRYLDIINNNQVYYSMPIVFSKMQNFLNAKFSCCIFGYMFEYTI